MKYIESIGEMISYRTPMRITKRVLFLNNNLYPVCPKCDISFEQEYQAFCASCGQKLDWGGYAKLPITLICN